MRLSELPNWLKNSEIYDQTKEEDSEIPDYSEDYILLFPRTDTLIDLGDALTVCNYWGVYSFPINVLKAINDYNYIALGRVLKIIYLSF